MCVHTYYHIYIIMYTYIIVSGIAMSCGIGHRHGSDVALLLLWLWLAAVVPIGPIGWEPPCAMSVTLKSKKKRP